MAGRILKQARPVLAARKARSSSTSRWPPRSSTSCAIYDLAKRTGTPLLLQLLAPLQSGNCRHVQRSPGGPGARLRRLQLAMSTLEPGHPDLFYYGIHGMRTAVYDYGPGLQDRQPGENADGRPGGRLSGMTAGWAPSAAFATARWASAPRCSARRESRHPGTSEAMIRSWWKSSSSSRPASPPSTPNKPWKSTPLWKPPTKAN